MHPVVVSSLIAVAVMTALFFALPRERACVLPASPLVILIADRLSSPRISPAERDRGGKVGLALRYWQIYCKFVTTLCDCTE
jgi:hypothetical protein